MKDAGVAALASLVRWRAFREALAERDREAAAAQVRTAQTRCDDADAAVAAIARRRDAVLSAPQLDLDLLQAVSAFETRALDDAASCADALADRERGLERACDAQLRARADLRVAESRHRRLVAEEADREEKRLFDRMASLMAVANGDSSDD